MDYNSRRSGAASTQFSMVIYVVAIQGISVDTIFNGLLAEISALLDT